MSRYHYLILSLLLFLTFTYITCTIKVDSPEKDAQGRPLLRLTASQLCESCQATIEDFYIMMIQAVATGKRELSLTAEELLTNFCQGWPMTSYRKHFEWGCLKLLSENYQEMLSPFIGKLSTADFPSYRQVFDHRTSMCHKYGSCPWSDYPYPTIIPESRCDACERVVADTAWMIERHKIKNMTLVKGVMENVCHQIPIRHLQHTLVDELCVELMDDHPTAIAQRLLAFNSETENLRDLQFSICGGVVHECEKKKQSVTVSTHRPGDERYKSEEQKKKERREAQAELDRKRKEKKEKKEKRQKEMEEKQKQREEAAKIEREKKKAEKAEKARKAAEEAEKEPTPPTVPPEVIVASHEKKAPFKKQKDTHKETPTQTPTETPTETSQHVDKEEL